MPTPSSKIKHFILMRFFSFYDPRYPHNIYDVDFLAKNLNLAKNNGLPSLANQSSKNFTLLFLVNEKFFDNKKYKFIFKTLQDCCTEAAIDFKFIKISPKRFVNKVPKYESTELPALFKDAFNNYEYVIQSRMDFDDFLYKDAIADTQRKVDECETLLAYGYSKGYSYVNGELYSILKTFNHMGYLGVLGSMIMKSSLAKTIPFFTMFNFSNDKTKLFLENYCAKNGIEFSENMLQINTEVEAFVYYRHEDSHATETISKGDPTRKVRKLTPLTAADITKKHLAEEFACHLEFNQIK